MRHFGSFKRLKAASVEDISQVKGVSVNLAETIYERTQSLEEVFNSWPAKLDTGRNSWVRAADEKILLNQEYIKRIPFFVRGHITGKSCEYIAQGIQSACCIWGWTQML